MIGEPATARGRRVALIFQPKADGAERLARRSADAVARWGGQPDVVPSTALTPDRTPDDAALAVIFGGDGTILQTAQWLRGQVVPIVGVQLGRLGFLAEVAPRDVPSALQPYFEGDWWPDRRSMLDACVRLSESAADEAIAPPAADGYLALNDVVLSRGAAPRTIGVDLSLGEERLHTFRCDGLIVASATGSTAYSFAAGGPILAPESHDLVVTAICPHISSLRTLVLPGDVPLRLQVWTKDSAVASFDGQKDVTLRDGGVVEIRRSTHLTVFARRGTPAGFYGRVLSKLG